MQNYITALKAEQLKRKGTGVYLTAVIMGAIIPIIITIVTFFMDDESKPGLPYNMFIKTLKTIVPSFSGFFFPLLIIITASRLTQFDHKNGGWQLMETQPVRKISIYFSKFTILLLTNLTAILAFVLTTYIGSLILSWTTDVPDVAYVAFEPSTTLWLIVRLFLAGMVLSALQYAISVLLPSFIWSILIGIALLLSYSIVSAFQPFPDWYPLALLNKISTYPKGSQLGYWITYSEAVSIFLSTILLYIGFKWYKHKNPKRAFVSSGARIGKVIAVIAIFGGLMWYTLKPNAMVQYTKTVIAGKVESEAPIDNLYLLDHFINDTVAVIPVENKEFHYVIEKDIPLDYYILNFGKVKGNVVIGNKDSVYIDVRINKDAAEADFYGTRIAENQYNTDKKDDFKWSSVSYDLEYNRNLDNPNKFIKDLVDEWKEDINKSDNFKTVDNYIPREDFLLKNKKVLTIQYLNYWNSFVKKRKALYPDEKTEPSQDIKEMIATVPLNDEGLLGDKEYFNYLQDQLIAKNKEEIDENTKTLMAIEKMEKGSFKDKMLYWQLEKSLEDASTAKERDSIMAKYNPMFGNKKYAYILNGKNKIYSNLESGKAAPLFEAMDKNQKNYNLADFKGKYVILDVWATWCGPCEIQRPDFEKFALKYKDHPIEFIAVSTDKRIDNWYVEVNDRSKSVLQLHLNDIDKFHKEYNVVGIPRFILIDPAGNFVNSQMPFPSEANFEKMLRDALGLDKEK